MKTNTATGSAVKLHEIFVSRQGEGLFVGAKQIFVRFSRCNMTCSYCDTDNEAGRVASLEQIAVQLERLRWREEGLHSLSLTGGEPLLHAGAIPALSGIARGLGLPVFLETNGTLPEAMRRVRPSVAIVSMDIKIPSVGNTRPYWREHAEFLKECRGLTRYVKLVVSEGMELGEFSQAVELVAAEDPALPTVIQPATPLGGVVPPSAEKLGRLRELALTRLWDVRVQPQWHKLWKVK